MILVGVVLFDFEFVCEGFIRCDVSKVDVWYVIYLEW